MKHAKGREQKEDYKEIEIDTNNIAEDIKSSRNYKLIKFMINIPVLFIIIYLYNQFNRNINLVPQSIRNIIYFIFTISSIYFIIATNYILQSSKFKLEKLFLIVMIPVSICYSLIMIPGMVPDEATHMRLTYSLASQIMGVEQDKITLRGEEKYIYDRLPSSPNIDSYEYSYTHFFQEKIMEIM